MYRVRIEYNITVFPKVGSKSIHEGNVSFLKWAVKFKSLRITKHIKLYDKSFRIFKKLKYDFTHNHFCGYF